jgi:hypothetical protein
LDNRLGLVLLALFAIVVNSYLEAGRLPAELNRLSCAVRRVSLAQDRLLPTRKRLFGRLLVRLTRSTAQPADAMPFSTTQLYTFGALKSIGGSLIFL